MILKVKGQNYVRFIGVVYSLSCIGKFSNRYIFLGAAVSYTLFFIEFFEMALYHVDHPPLQREIIYLCLSLCIVVPASFIDNLALFAKLSNIANVIINISKLTQVLVVYSFSAIMIFSLANTEEVTIKYFDISNITTMIGVVLYAYINPVSTLAFKLVMRNQGQFRRLTLVTNLTVFTTYLIFSLVSSIKYGD